MTCPCCGKKLTVKARNTPVEVNGRKVPGTHTCQNCGAIGGTVYLGESYTIVKPFMTGEDVPMDETVYFDFQTLGGEGIGRRHGWYDPKTRLVVQAG
jgi:hypothetical protein